MSGLPRDVPGECNAHLYIGDDHGDNCATMRCAEPAGHPPPHRETYGRAPQRVTVTWTEDERPTCESCADRVHETHYCDGCERKLCETCFGRPAESCSSCLNLYCAECDPGHECRFWS